MTPQNPVVNLEQSEQDTAEPESNGPKNPDRSSKGETAPEAETALPFATTDIDDDIAAAIQSAMFTSKKG